MDIVELKARERSGVGKSYTRKARVQGWIPAVYYGHNRDSKLIEVDAKIFTKMVRDKQISHLINLRIEGIKEKLTTIIKEIQRDILKKNRFLHIDFQHVSMDEKITVECAVEISGTPIGVKEQDGIFEHPVRHVSVECLALNIPEKISVDVSQLNVGDSIHIKDLNIENAVIKNSPDEVVAMVSAPVKEIREEVTAEEAEEATEETQEDKSSASEENKQNAEKSKDSS